MTAERYGMFRDEFYYHASASRLDWGYVDHPPLSIWILAATRAVLGDSLLATRLPAILAAVLVVVGTGMLARRLGGGLFAQALAMVCVVACPMLLGIHSYYSMNSFDHLFWLAAAYVLVALIDRGSPRLWLVLGAVSGIGLLNKTSMAFFGIGLVAAIALTPLRRWLATPWPYAGGVLAFVLYLPNVFWQWSNDFAMLEFMRNAAQYKNAPMSPLVFLGEVVKTYHPVLLPVWAAGVLYPFVVERARRWRPLAIVFLAVLLVFIVGNGKPYYAAPAFSLMFALGAVWVGAATTGRRRVRVAVLAAIAIAGAVAAPMAVPLLPPAQALAYMQTIGLAPKPMERSHIGAMPQHFADRFGWRERAELVQRVFATLPPEEQQQAVVIGLDYGEAGAIEYHADELGLPPAISPHNSYGLWGPGRAGREVNLLIAPPGHPVIAFFESVEDFGTVDAPFQLDPWRSNRVYIARGLKRPVDDVWAEAKAFRWISQKSEAGGGIWITGL